MSKKQIISRIHKLISPELMQELDKICENVIISDNNIKVKAIRQALENHGVDYNELGPGTNRFAVHIDGYAFKIAMDRMGKLDNANEFSMSKELQPFVIKVYENNDLISVSEYVTLVSRDEFLDRREEFLEVLSQLADTYLLGDVGYVEKNFTNWGYRDNGDVVILDFAYIHYIEGKEILCRKDGTMLEYTADFHMMRCPQCGKKYSFSSIRSKITMEKEWEYINLRKSEAYKLVDENITISKKDKGNKKIKKYIEEKERKKKIMKQDIYYDEDEHRNSIESDFGDDFKSDMARLMAARNRKNNPVVDEIEEEVVEEVIEEEPEILVEVEEEPVQEAEETPVVVVEPEPPVVVIPVEPELPAQKVTVEATQTTVKVTMPVTSEPPVTLAQVVEEEAVKVTLPVVEEPKQEDDILLKSSVPIKATMPRKETPMERYERLARENGFAD